MRKRSVFVVSLLLIALLFAAGAHARTQVVIWGLNPLAVGSGNQEMIDAFHEAHPHIELLPQSTPGTDGYATQDVAKLLAAIASGNPPDITWLDRFTAAQFAARNALTPLDEFIAKYELDMSGFADYTVDEIIFNGQTWALPWDTDTRILFWNRDLFRDAGVDPYVAPQTWDDLLEYTQKLTSYDAAGNFNSIGFIPNYGNSWLYLYGFQNGGEFLSADGRTAKLNDPRIVEALEFMVKGYDVLGGAERVNAYASTFQGEANNPFLTGQVAMLINVNNAIMGYTRFAPDLDYQADLAPTPDGTNKITWSGGWSYAIPRGAKNAEAAFEVIKWLTTEGIKYQSAGAAAFTYEQGRPYHVPFPAAYMPTNNELLETYVDPIDVDAIRDAVQVGIDAMAVSRARPVSPVGEILWVEHARAIDRAIYREMSPQEALDLGNQQIQRELDRFWARFGR